MRFTPSCARVAAVFALVALAVLTPAGRPCAAASCPAPEAFAGVDTFTYVNTVTGVRQPFDGSTTVAACSLAVAYSYYSHGQLSVYAWDPLALAPDASTLALWTRHYDPSRLHLSHVGASFTGGLVVTAVAGVAERLRTSLVLDYRSADPYNPQRVYYDTNAPASVAGAHLYSTDGSGYAPLAGPHPALGSTFCPAEGDVAAERILQGVVTTSQSWTSPPWAVAQKFRVPLRGELHRVQIACDANAYYAYTAGVLDVYDAAGQVEPPASWGTPLMHTTFLNDMGFQSAWAGHYPFDQYSTLEPGHDYWLVVTLVNQIPIFSRTLTGGEGPDFTAGVRGLWTRASTGGAWSAEPARALSFQLIGRPDPAAVAVPPAAPRAFALAVEPNPAPGPALVRWDGARGAVDLDVLDVRGRRVARATGAAGGSWWWRGTREDGSALPTGVYFVHARDRSGLSGVARVVLVR